MWQSITSADRLRGRVLLAVLVYELRSRLAYGPDTRRIVVEVEHLTGESVPYSTIAYHVRGLEAAGLLFREDSWVRLTPDGIRAAADFLAVNGAFQLDR